MNKITTGPTSNSLLVADVEFCLQAGRIQERLISSPSLDFAQTLALDAHLVYWFESLPSFLHAPEQCPEWMSQPRLSAKWKYLNLRIILYRPILMEAALRRIPFQQLDTNQKVCVRKCQSLASQAIHDISLEWTKNQYSGWPAAWHLFQACIIPLLSLYGFKDDLQQIETWTLQVEKAIQVFEEMQRWSIAARQTHHVVSLLYEAYQRLQRLNDSALEATPGVMASVWPSEDSQPVLPPSQSQNTVDWPLWEGLSNFPDLMSPTAAFPDLNFPELGPGMNVWDMPGQAEVMGEIFDATLRHGQINEQGLRTAGMFSGAWSKRP